VATHLANSDELSMMTLKILFGETDTRPSRIFDWCIVCLIIVSAVTFSIETLPTLPPFARSVLQAVEIITVLVFTLEYALRIYVASHKRDYIFSFFGLIDLIAILPFYLGLGIDLRSVRALRLLRLARLLKLARYNQAIRRFHLALCIAKEEIVLFLAAAIILIYLAGVGIYYFESEAQPDKFGSVFHSVWWAVVTLTTVGYGDVYPVTVGGRVFSFFVLLIGIGVISVPAGLVASALGKARKLEEQESGPASDRVE
jgi:voltage-gated potassium channel